MVAGAGPEADKPVNRLISRSADEVRLFQRVDDAVAEIATSSEPPATPADAIAALARLCGTAPAGVAPGCGATPPRTTVIEAEPADPSPAAVPVRVKTPPPTASASASHGTAPAPDRAAGTPAAADCADADMADAAPAPPQPEAASRQDGATHGCESNFPGGNAGKSPESGSAGGGSASPVKAEPAMESNATPPRERVGADSGAGGGLAGEPPPAPAEPAVRLRCVLRGDGSVACHVSCSGGTPPAGDEGSGAAFSGAAEKTNAGTTGSVASAAARSPQQTTDVAVMHEADASAAVAPEPSSAGEGKKAAWTSSASAGEAEPTRGGPCADTCCNAGRCSNMGKEAQTEAEDGGPAEKEEPTAAEGGVPGSTAAAPATAASLAALREKNGPDAGRHAAEAETDAPATAQGSAAAGSRSKCTPAAEAAGSDAEATGAAPMDTDDAAAAGDSDAAAATAPTDAAADAAADCADVGGDVAGTSAASQVLARLAHAEVRHRVASA